MDKIRIKCPVCGAVLEVLDNPAFYEKNVVCPLCKEKRKFKEFKRLTTPAPLKKNVPNDKTEIALGQNGQKSDETEKIIAVRNTNPGYLIDMITCKRYDLKIGKFTIGRKPSKSNPKADIAIETEDLGMSRVHMSVKVVVASDGICHIYVSNADNKNPSYINGEIIRGGDVVGVKHGDILRLCDTELKYVNNDVDDNTELITK